MKSKVSELVEIAKGEDRSVREYGRQSGVDPTVISKIIKGSYIPRKPEVYRKLTSSSAAPRGGITLSQLLEAANASESYKEGIAAGIASVTPFMNSYINTLNSSGDTTPATSIATIIFSLASLSSLIISANGKKKTDDKEAKQYLTDIQKFIANANGIIFSRFAVNGILFQKIPQKYHDILGNDFDTLLKLYDQPINEYLLRYLYLSPSDRKIDFLVRNAPQRLMEDLLLIEPSEGRKISIITNSQESLEHMLQFKDKLSYRGNLSMILVDTEELTLVREEYLAHHDLNNPVELMI